MKGIIELCRKVVKALLEITVIAGLLTVIVGSNLELKQLFSSIALISIALAIVIDFAKGAVIDRQKEEWVKF